MIYNLHTCSVVAIIVGIKIIIIIIMGVEVAGERVVRRQVN